MPDTSQFKISSKQLIFIILGNTVATGMLSLPRLASADAHQDAWLAVIGGAVSPILVLLLIQQLYQKFPGCNLVDISCFLFGRIMGTLLLSLVVLYFLAYQAALFSNLAEVTMAFIIPQTPHRTIMIVSILAMIYIASHGAQVVARINEIFLYPFLLLIVLWIIPVSVGDYTNLLPIGGSGWEGIAAGTLTTSFAYSGIEILLLLYPAVTKTKEIMKAGLTAVGITLTFYLILTCAASWYLAVQ